MKHGRLFAICLMGLAATALGQFGRSSQPIPYAQDADAPIPFDSLPENPPPPDDKKSQSPYDF